MGATALAAVAAAVVEAAHDRSVLGTRASYRCPMHPDVVAHAPGACPICGMALERAAVDSDKFVVSTSPSPPRQGQYTIREVIFTDTIRAAAWVEARGVLTAHMSDDEIATLRPGAIGRFTLASSPGESADAQLSAEPVSAWDCCTSSVRFRVDASDSRLARGATGWLGFPPKVRRELLVPAAAVLYAPGGPYVLAAGPDGGVPAPRLVRLGKVFSGNAVVLGGLFERESVVTSGVFFIDAERKLQGGDGPQAGEMP